MSSQRFTPEFKEEAVRQVIERGYSVSEVSARLGVSTHSEVEVDPISQTPYCSCRRSPK